MSDLDAAVTAAFKVVAYAVHDDDKADVVAELADALRPFVETPYDPPGTGTIKLPSIDHEDGPEHAHPTWGLSEGDVVRFPRPGKVRPDTGHIMGVNADGSFLIFNDRTKLTRSLMPDDIERQVLGPRGGVNWEPVVK